MTDWAILNLFEDGWVIVGCMETAVATLRILPGRFCRVMLSGAAIFEGTPVSVLGNLILSSFEYAICLQD